MHTVHVFKNSRHEIYVAVRATGYWYGDVIAKLTQVARNCDWDQFKNDMNLNSFMVENDGDVTLETYPYTGVFHKDNSRLEEIEKWVAMGYIEYVRTETEAKAVASKRVKKDDRSADKYFSEVTKSVSNVDLWVAYYGKESLINARKTLTVGEMIAAYPWPPTQEEAA